MGLWTPRHRTAGHLFLLAVSWQIPCNGGNNTVWTGPNLCAWRCHDWWGKEGSSSWISTSNSFVLQPLPEVSGVDRGVWQQLIPHSPLRTCAPSQSGGWELYLSGWISIQPSSIESARPMVLLFSSCWQAMLCSGRKGWNDGYADAFWVLIDCFYGLAPEEAPVWLHLCTHCFILCYSKSRGITDAASRRCYRNECSSDITIGLCSSVNPGYELT